MNGRDYDSPKNLVAAKMPPPPLFIGWEATLFFFCFFLLLEQNQNFLELIYSPILVLTILLLDVSLKVNSS